MHTLTSMLWKYFTDRLRDKGLFGVVVALAVSLLVTAFLCGFWRKEEEEEEEGNPRGQREQLLELRRRRQQRRQQGSNGERGDQTSCGHGNDASMAGAGGTLLVGKFFGARVITICANDVLFSRVRQNQFVVHRQALSAVSALSRETRGGLFIISKVETDEEEAAVRALLTSSIGTTGESNGWIAGSSRRRLEGGVTPAAAERAGCATSSETLQTTEPERLQVEAHKFLFCSTDIGKTAIVRYRWPPTRNRTADDGIDAFVEPALTDTTSRAAITASNIDL